jgi:hypothetical protein
MSVKLRHYLRDRCICYIEGRLVVNSIWKYGLVRRAVAYLCLRVMNACEL